MLEIIGLALAVIVPLVGFSYHRRHKLKAQYEVIWRKSSYLKPAQVLGIRGHEKHGFHHYYHPRQHDTLIINRIQKGQNVLVIGNPLAGKTRSVYQALLGLNKPHAVIVPNLRDVNTEDFRIPLRFRWRRKKILLLDDIDKFFDYQNFMYLLQQFIRKGVIVVATCRSGPEYQKVCTKMERELSTVFGNPIEVAEISENDAKEVTKQTSRKLPDTFDGNIGSIFLQLDTMKERFRDCSEIEKVILRSLKRLYFAGVYEQREIFSIERIKYLCRQKHQIDMKNYEWDELFRKLGEKGFVEIKKEQVQAEETYLQFVIEDRFDPLGNIHELTGLFENDPDALVSIGNQAYEIGTIDLRKAYYMHAGIEAYQKGLQLYTFDRFPSDYAMVQNNLGAAYQTLAGVEDKANNCEKAIQAYQQALKVRTLDQFPMDYAMTQNNLGNAYQTVAEVEDKANNSKKAIQTYQQALNVYTLDQFPIQYATTQNNLGTAYRTLAEVEDKANNCEKAIQAYQQALKVGTLDQFPMDYAMTQNNLGNAYRTLAEVEDKAKNCKKAIQAFQLALKVRTLDQFPMDYATTQNNLGNAYQTVADVEDKANNCKRAEIAYKEALKIFTNDKLPEPQGVVERNLKSLRAFCADIR